MHLPVDQIFSPSEKFQQVFINLYLNLRPIEPQPRIQTRIQTTVLSLLDMLWLSQVDLRVEAGCKNFFPVWPPDC